MRRIAAKFESLAAPGRRGFIPFITAGDPSLQVTLEVLVALEECGADIIELGVPFSDPMADGPTIQRSSQRALRNDVTVSDVLKVVRKFRSISETPVVLFGYFNPFFYFGIDRFASEAQAAGVDAVLVTDVIGAEAVDLSERFAEKDIDLISLIAPTTSDERLREIAVRARGFLYAIGRNGVTGTADRLDNAAEHLVARARKVSDLPIAVGFGISTPGQITEIWKFADAAVVGSAIVAEIEKSPSAREVAKSVRTFVSTLVPQFAKTSLEP